MGEEYCSDPQLWKACAGSLVDLPEVNSTACYFPQGHAEHCREELVSVAGKIPSFVRCKVESVVHYAHKDTDDVFAKIFLEPLKHDQYFNEYLPPPDLIQNQRVQDWVVVKCLSQSDVNNGGGFSVPRLWSIEILPQLDFTQRPPVQTITVTDIHGKEWKFRHIYRGTPRRHLFTTGWSGFVSEKKLTVGDSVVLVKSRDDVDLRIGIRRKIRDDPQLEESSWRKRRNSDAESLMSAVSLAVSGEKFEVVYYPRWRGVPEFVVRASSVYCSTRIQWCQGMRFKMSFETGNDRLSLCMGTINSSMKAYDKTRFPDSPWRALEVTWDEINMADREDLEKLSPWSVQLVSNMPAPPPVPQLNNNNNNNLYLSRVPLYNYNLSQFNLHLPIPPLPLRSYGTFQYPNCPNPFSIPMINLPDMNSTTTSTSFNPNPNPSSISMNPSSTSTTPMNPSSTSTTSTPMNPSTSSSTPMNPSTSSSTPMNPSNSTSSTPMNPSTSSTPMNPTNSSTPMNLSNSTTSTPMNPSTSSTPMNLSNSTTSTPMNPSTSSTPTPMNPSTTPTLMNPNNTFTLTMIDINLPDINTSTSTSTPKRLDHEVENETNGGKNKTVTIMLLGTKISVDK